MATKFSGQRSHLNLPTFLRLPARVKDVRNGAVCWTRDGRTSACGYSVLHADFASPTDDPLNCDRGGCLAVEREEAA